MEFRQIKETCLYVQDLERTRQFYEGKLGLSTISMLAGRHVFFRAGSSVLLCFLPDITKNDQRLPPHYSYGKQHIAFEVAREVYAKTRKEFQEAGIDIIHDEEWPGGYFSFYFLDPDGHVLEVVPQGMWG